MDASQPPEQFNFAEVFERARRGDPDATAQLYAAYGGRVAALVRRRLTRFLRQKYDTMDVADSVFAEVLRSLPNLENRGEDAFIALLAAKAAGNINSKLRRHLGKGGHRAEQRLATDADLPVRGEGETRSDTEEETRKLRALVADLDETTRSVVRLRNERKSFGAISEELGLASPDAARKRYARALIELRKGWKLDDAGAPPASGARPAGLRASDGAEAEGGSV